MSANISIPFDTIKRITNNFSDDQKVGSGGYGVVYQALYKDEKIAVKRLHPWQGHDNKEFENEVFNLRKIKHGNVVKLTGFCRALETGLAQHGGQETFSEKWERILCFEYMPGALDKHITAADFGCNLDWPTCYKIIKGTCEGINHLHNKYKNKPILHLDLKPENILLDDNNNPKIADFGLSRIMAKQSLVTKDEVKGTVGYMPPEYIRSQHISDKYDVFSLGVLILNVLVGKRVWSRRNEMRAAGQFVNNVCGKWNERWLAENPGHRPSHKIESLQVRKCVELALKCIQTDRHKRPSTKEIVRELKQFDARIIKLSQQSDDDQIGQGLDTLELNSSNGDLSQIPSEDHLHVDPSSGPGELDVVIVYAFDCSDWTKAWYTVDHGIFWMVQKKLAHYENSCMGYIYPMMYGNTYTSDMKIVDSEDTNKQSYTAVARRRVACAKNMACGLDEAHKMIRNRGYQNGVILLFSDGLKHKGDFFNGAEEFESDITVHTFTLGGLEFNEGLRAIAGNSPDGKFHTIPVPERPTLSDHFSLLLDHIFDRNTIEDEPTPSSEMQPLDVVLVYAFDCSESTLDWLRMDSVIFWMVQKKLTRSQDSCMGYIYPMLAKNNYTSDMKLVDSEESKDTGYTSFARYRLTCTKNMASGLPEAHKMIRNRGYQNGIILFFSDGLINKGDFFDGTDNFNSEFPVHTFTLGGNAYNKGLEAIANKSPGGKFHSTPVPDRPELSTSFSDLLDSILGTKTE